MRLSTHQANGERIGNVSADDKISIVIRKNGEHVSTGEHNGYLEFVFEPSEVSPKDAANAILSGIQNLIEKGEFIDETGKAHRQEYPYEENGKVIYSIDGDRAYIDAVWRGDEKTNGDTGAVYDIESYKDDSRMQVDSHGGKQTMYRVKGVDSGLFGEYNAVDKLVDAMREKFPDRKVTLSEDGKHVEVSDSPKVRQGKGYDAYLQKKTERARRVVAEHGEKYGLDIELVEDERGLTEKQKKAKGWYDPVTGKIKINLGRHHSEADIKRTILHEGVAHHGLRKMMGKAFNSIMRGIYTDLGRDVQKRVEALGRKLGLTDKVTMLEEYMARLAEDMNFDKDGPHIWAKIGYHLTVNA